MTTTPDLPTEPLRRLPRWLRVGYAARCARRAQPLFLGFWPHVRDDYRQEVESAIVVGEEHSRLYTDAGEDWSSEYGRAIAAAMQVKEIERTAMVDLDAKNNRRGTSVVLALRSAHGAALSAANAIEHLNASRLARTYVGPDHAELLALMHQAWQRSEKAAVLAVESAYNSCRCVYNAYDFFKAIWDDFNHLVTVKSDVIETPLAHDVGVFPSDFGDLWPSGIPTEWCEYRAAGAG